MDMSFTPEDLAFRDEVRNWIADALPADVAAKAKSGEAFSREDTIAWHKILYE